MSNENTDDKEEFSGMEAIADDIRHRPIFESIFDKDEWILPLHLKGYLYPEIKPNPKNMKHFAFSGPQSLSNNNQLKKDSPF